MENETKKGQEERKKRVCKECKQPLRYKEGLGWIYDSCLKTCSMYIGSFDNFMNSHSQTAVTAEEQILKLEDEIYVQGNDTIDNFKELERLRKLKEILK